MRAGDGMIYLYTKKRDGEDWILQNDWYFNLYTGNQPFTEEEKMVVERIDGAKVSDDKRFINFECSNQYLLFLRNCDGLNLSSNSFTVLSETGNVVTLKKELDQA